MEFHPIFTVKEECNLWAVCYLAYENNAESNDVFNELFNLWNNTEYLQNFFIEHKNELFTPFWNGMTIDNAVDQVMDEAENFEDELRAIETKEPGYENKSLNQVFEHLHDNIYSLNWSNENHRKARPNLQTPMLRLYAIELEDGTFVVTGGAIKLTQKMTGERFDTELKNLNIVEEYLKKEGIINKEGLTLD